MPVRAVQTASVRISTAVSSTVQRTSTRSMGMLWHRGISSAVRLAALMPASWATASTSPLRIWFSRIRRTVSGWRRTRAKAEALRGTSGFPETSTCRARPSSSTWLSGMG